MPDSLESKAEGMPEAVEASLAADPYQEYRQQRRWVEQVNQHHYEDAQRRHAEAQRRHLEQAEQQRRWVDQVNRHHYEDAQRRHAAARPLPRALVDTPPKPIEHQDEELTESQDLQDAQVEGMPESLEAEAEGMQDSLEAEAGGMPEASEANLAADPYQEYREHQRRWVEQV